MKHLLSIRDLKKEDIHWIINKAQELKQKDWSSQKLLEGKNLAMIFEKRSTRTRTSMEVAMNQLGGHAVFLGKEDIHLGTSETLKDTSMVLSRYVDFIAARVYKQSTLEELAKHSTVPVINLLSDLEHPCQALGDMLTIKERFGWNVKIAYVGDGNNVCNSLILIASKLGIDINVGCPKGYEPDKDILREAENRVFVTEDPKEAVKDCDVIYTDVWVSMGQTGAKKREKLFKPYQVNENLVKDAKDNFAFMHCLPNHHLEVTDDIFYSENSIVWDQAENRLHSAKGILLFLEK